MRLNEPTYTLSSSRVLPIAKRHLLLLSPLMPVVPTRDGVEFPTDLPLGSTRLLRIVR